MKRLILILCLLAGNGYASFSYYTPLTIDHTKCGSGNSSDFPVLFSSTDNRFKTTGNGGHVQNGSGFDVRPYSDSGLSSALSFQLEKYDGSTGQVIMWIKVPTVSASSDTTIYIAYGDSSLSSDGSTSATWNSNYKGVYHFGDGTTLSVSDSTSNGNNGTNTGATAGTGQIYGCAVFNGSSNWIDLAIGATVYTQSAPGYSFEAWVKSGTTASGICVWGEWNDNTSTGASMSNASTNKIRMSGSGLNITGSTVVWNDTWKHVMWSDNAGTASVYVNGIADATSFNYTPGASVTVDTIAIGANRIFHGSEFDFFNGSIEEVRVSNTARNADWALTSYNNQNNPGTFYSLGTEVPTGGPPVTRSKFFFNS